MSSSERWTQCAHQTSSGEPAELARGTRPAAAVELAAVLLLLDRLGEVRVQLQAEPARELRRLAHQLARDRERRARRDRDLHRARRRRAARDEPLRVGEDVVELLDERVGRQAAVATRRGPSSPREATIRTPSSRAARTSASTSPARPRGKT